MFDFAYRFVESVFVFVEVERCGKAVVGELIQYCRKSGLCIVAVLCTEFSVTAAMRFKNSIEVIVDIVLCPVTVCEFSDVAEKVIGILF